MKGGLGLAEDTSDASVAVRQTGPIKVKEGFKNGDDAFTEKRSVLFKQLHVSRFWDASHQSFCVCGMDRPGHQWLAEEFDFGGGGAAVGVAGARSVADEL